MKERILIGPETAFEELAVHCVEHEGVPYCVVRAGGGLCAFVAVCAHKDLPMFPPEVRKGRLVCPHHKISFDPRSGEVADDRGKKIRSGLPGVAIEIIDGIVFLETRGKHRRLLSKKERRRVSKKAVKLQRASGENDERERER